MKKAALLIYIIVFLIVCITPSLLTLFGVKSQNFEKRDLAPAPKIIDNGINLEYTKDFDDYFSDNFALRPYFVTAYAKIAENVFKTSVSDRVVVGKEGFLFFGETLGAFTGQDSLSDAELESICEELKKAQDYFNAQDIEFFFVCAPNKSTIYPEYMPKRYNAYNVKSNITRLQEKMDDYGINYTDVREDLIQAKEYEQLYHKDDSHWNNYGAVIAYENMMGETSDLLNGKEYPIYSDLEYRKDNVFRGDLATMLFPSSEKKDMQIIYDMPNNFKAERPLVNLEAIEIITKNETQSKKAYIFRDSFFNALIPFFSEGFEYVEYSRKVPYDFEYAASKDVDIVILEIVERNLPLLHDNFKK